MKKRILLDLCFIVLVFYLLEVSAVAGVFPKRRRGPRPHPPRSQTLQDAGQKNKYLCRPPGRGPFPAVIYNHGGKGNSIGGAPKETCEALAQLGVVGYAPIRRPTVSMQGHIDDVLAAVDYVKTLAFVDPTRLGIMGFSRGGLLTLEAAIQRPADFKAVVLMAPAPGGEGNLEKLLGLLQPIAAPVLIQVALNDKGGGADHVAISQRVDRALKAGGKKTDLILYPPYGNDGHRMFFEIGAYWKDVEEFLRLLLAIK